MEERTQMPGTERIFMPPSAGPLEAKETAVTAPVAPSLAPGRGSRVAYHLLHAGFTAAPLLAGADKFTNLMTDWECYLAGPVARLFGRRRFMRFVGVVEMAGGAMVAFKPKVGAYVVAGWLGGIMVNLAIESASGRRYWDIALRDLGLMLGALSLGELARERG